MSRIVCRLESCDIMGARFEVYKEKGSGFLESVYQEWMELELADRKIPLKAPPEISLSCKGRPLKSRFSRISFARRKSCSN